MLQEIQLLALRARLLATEAIFEEMKSENYSRIQNNLSLAYDNFNSITEECERILKDANQIRNYKLLNKC